MDSRSQQPMIICSSSGSRQQGSGNALNLYLLRCIEKIKKCGTTGNSSSFDNISSGNNGTNLSPLSIGRRYALVAVTCESEYIGKVTGRTPQSAADQNASNQSIRRSPLCNVDQNPVPGFVLDSTVTGS
ncbi:hypothetical protein DCAR_0623487 [Daucus carota subsp. sativus]|uniref:Uncharacterized protein n=1 Tax=Daucus carota subsp. sativus TaxID=79200 RepID=A0A175YCK5_DAUCS|nr:hypothetical protein DCAR_0623487 [Daucus carota subsp. sativus]